MIDREKVIKGLETCVGENDFSVCVEEKCPYIGGSENGNCITNLERDAIALLKEQESMIEALKSDLNETLSVLGEQPDIVRCKDCKHRPTAPENRCLVFPDSICPCQVDDNWYSWWPKDDWFCANGEKGDG